MGHLTNETPQTDLTVNFIFNSVAGDQKLHSVEEAKASGLIKEFGDSHHFPLLFMFFFLIRLSFPTRFM